MYIIIVGCGRVGSLLADILSREGHDVVVIDSSEAKLKKLNPQFSGVTILGDGADINTLREAKVDGADVLVTATGDDNSNLMSAQIAKKIFHVPRALVRVKDPKKMDVYQEYDLEPVSATNLAAHRLAEMVRVPRGIETLANLGDIKIVQIKLPTLQASQKLTRIVAAGIFSLCLVRIDGKVALTALEAKLLPGSEVVGAITVSKMKHLNQISQER
jgi:trk system potassium uptake protein TrkA